MFEFYEKRKRRKTSRDGGRESFVELHAPHLERGGEQ